MLNKYVLRHYWYSDNYEKILKKDEKSFAKSLQKWKKCVPLHPQSRNNDSNKEEFFERL